MIPTTIHDDRSFTATPRCRCGDTFVFDTSTGALGIRSLADTSITADAFVWQTLKVGDLGCGCGNRVRRWRCAPAIPDRAVADERTRTRRRAIWRRLDQFHLADWELPTTAVPLFKNQWAEPFTTLAWARLEVRTATEASAWEEAGIIDPVDALEWDRAGATRPEEVDAWLAAGATDGHDAACRARAGQTPDTIDRRTNGCVALADRWPGTRPGTSECAARQGVAAGAAIARLVVALDGGGVIELYDGQHGESPVITAVTLGPAGRETKTRRVHLPRPNPTAMHLAA